MTLGPLAEQLTIETPEQTALEFAVAGIGSRFLALALDILIQTLIGIVVGIAASLIIAGAELGSPKAGMWVAAFFILFYFLLYFGYYAAFEIAWNGQTPGKRTLGIRVMKDSGRPLTPAESIGRNLMRIVDWLPAFYGVGIVCAFCSKGNKRLGDLVVGSIVVRETKLSDLKPISSALSASAPPVPTSFGPLGAQLLSPDEISLIDTFLSRRLDLDPHIRYQMAESVLRKIRPKLTLAGDTSLLSTEKILEAVVYERNATRSYS